MQAMISCSDAFANSPSAPARFPFVSSGGTTYIMATGRQGKVGQPQEATAAEINRPKTGDSTGPLAIGPSVSARSCRPGRHPKFTARS